MPIVNLSNYTECCSCHRLAHIPGHVANAERKGNRAFICQQCYELADQDTSRENSDVPNTRVNLDKPTDWEMDQIFQAFARSSFNGQPQPHAALDAAIAKFIELRSNKP